MTYATLLLSPSERGWRTDGRGKRAERKKKLERAARLKMEEKDGFGRGGTRWDSVAGEGTISENYVSPISKVENRSGRMGTGVI